MSVPFVAGLKERNLLGPDLLFSHGQSFTDEELETLAEADVTMSAAEMLEMCTMDGARSLCRGRIDMMSGVEPEQIAVLQANGRDVDTVMVGGDIRKQGGVLVDADTQAVQRDFDESRDWLTRAYEDVDLKTIWRGYDRLIATDEVDHP